MNRYGVTVDRPRHDMRGYAAARAAAVLPGGESHVTVADGVADTAKLVHKVVEMRGDGRVRTACQRARGVFIPAPRRWSVTMYNDAAVTCPKCRSALTATPDGR
ncbi:MAG: hypothetical protein H7099_17470 [Gemmatimonadaceae bacterium]|nr:hypothetical protein [Gemmatimonadaceae bacterium]